MTPYYDDGVVTIYHGDCREIVPSLRRSSVGSVITDPPFFMPATHYSSRVEWPRSWGDAMVLGQWWADTLTCLTSVMHQTGSLAVFCDGASYPVFYPPMYRIFDDVGLAVWDKGRIGMGRPWRKQHELIAHGRWGSSWWAENEQGISDVLKFTTIPSVDRQHPVDKPVPLLARLVSLLAPDDRPLLDPFCGGGSTLLAARREGRSAIGIESEERYCEVAARRFDQQVLDLGA
jgi:DNA modification methylase